ncbi:RHS repeat-associated core domain-containing protein [Pseudoalteromonas aliena]|uniref:RHS repeat-associated core domain-containing protein n=1 Tax=Pseudoalteromonas aliena TaxID=247523 RepID=UPI0024944B8F|nr:polymorphic toxin type 15 domain-containing protein [Pseudoalteromonas aliena]
MGQLIQQTLASSRADTTTHYKWDSFGNPQSQTVQSNTSDADLRDIGEQGIEHDTASNEHTASSSIDLTRATHSEYNELALNSSESSSKNSSNADSVINNKSTNNTTINSATDADRLIHFGDSDFYYDEFGNQIRETGKGIKTRREYNAFNQLSCFNNNGTLTQYDYDPLGRRIAKHTEHGKVDYIWDNDQLIGECQHGEYTWYINLPNQFHPVALIKNCEVYYYHLDQLNTPRFVTNNKAEVVWENQADVYGYEEPKAESEFNKENTFTQPIRFQGQYLDEESGLHYNRYRYYSPKQQRFINQDPIGLVGGINHYQYAPNPVNWVDPFGLSCKETKPIEVPAYDHTDPMADAITPISITPVEWLVEGLADAAEAILQMVDTGPTAAGAAAVAIALVPGKAADKVLEPVVKKLDNMADAAKATVTQGAKKVARKMELHKVACFKKNKKGSDQEYDDQLQGQQDGINKMTVKEYLDNRESYESIKRKGTGAAQKKARDDFKDSAIIEYVDKLANDNVFGEEAEKLATEMAESKMKTLNALHNPDMIAGGNDIVEVLGDAGVNKSIGSQWKNKGINALGEKEKLSRVLAMDVQANNSLRDMGPNTYMNVNLHRCK